MRSEHQRVRIDLSYDGAGFHGWAVQPGLRTVQGELESVLSTVFQVDVPLTVAGRTDAGVHARGQVAGADIPSDHGASKDLQQLSERLNKLLAVRFARSTPGAIRGTSDVVISDMTAVSESFDARFSALERRYRYRLVDSGSARDPLSRFDRWWVPYSHLDLEAMQAAADALLGTRDFLSFCKPREGASTIRTLKELSVTREPGGDITVTVAADAFCHSMVRALVGALVEVGRGARDVEWVQGLVDSPSRDHGVPVAPAHGLTLVQVEYPPEDHFASAARNAKRFRDSTEVETGEDSGTLSPAL